MRPQKSKRFRGWSQSKNRSAARPCSPDNKNTHISNRWAGYYMEDIECKHCVHWRGRKKGCPFRGCAYEAEKLDAIKQGRIKRRGGDVLLAM